MVNQQVVHQVQELITYTAPSLVSSAQEIKNSDSSMDGKDKNMEGDLDDVYKIISKIV